MVTLERIEIDHQYSPWTPVFAKALGKSQAQVQAEINGNNALPIEEERDGKTIFPKFFANAFLLARASPGFSGPRGFRPSLAIAENIFFLSDFSTRQAQKSYEKFKRLFGGTGNILLNELELTASNPRNAPKGVKFSDNDIKAGIFIPRKIDKPTAQALGIAYGNGRLDNRDYTLILSTKLANEQYFKEIVRKIFENAFNFSQDKDPRDEEAIGSFSDKACRSVCLDYGSKALKTYLNDFIGFPPNIDTRKMTGLSHKIKQLDKGLQDEFLKYFFASTIAFNPKRGSMKICDVSEPLLRDIEAMITTRVQLPSSKICSDGQSSHYLSVGVAPTMELFLLGFFNGNPQIKKEVENYFTNQLKSRTALYLGRKYGNLIPTPAKMCKAKTDAEWALPAAETIVIFPPPTKETALVA